MTSWQQTSRGKMHRGNIFRGKTLRGKMFRGKRLEGRRLEGRRFGVRHLCVESSVQNNAWYPRQRYSRWCTSSYPLMQTSVIWGTQIVLVIALRCLFDGFGSPPLMGGLQPVYEILFPIVCKLKDILISYASMFTIWRSSRFDVEWWPGTWIHRIICILNVASYSSYKSDGLNTVAKNMATVGTLMHSEEVIQILMFSWNSTKVDISMLSGGLLVAGSIIRIKCNPYSYWLSSQTGILYCSNTQMYSIINVYDC